MSMYVLTKIAIQILFIFFIAFVDIINLRLMTNINTGASQ